MLDGDHHANSYIYWGSATGPNPARKTEIPTIGPHNMFGVDIGNLYSRKLEEEYQSAPHEAGLGQRPVRLEWQADTPFGTGLRFQIRTAESKDGLEHSSWVSPRGESTFWNKTGGRLLDVPKGRRWIQYRPS